MTGSYRKRGDVFFGLAVAAESVGQCGHSLMVEPQPSKLMMRVRFPLPAPVLVPEKALKFTLL